QSINAVLILVFIPLFTYGIYPGAEKFVRLTPQRKIGAGMFIVMPAFVITAYLQEQVNAGKHPSVWWQLLGYAIVTGAEILVSIPALEFAYTQAPKKMKSIIMAAYLAGSISFGNVIAAWVIAVLQSLGIKSDSGKYYWFLVGLIAVAALLYCLVS